LDLAGIYLEENRTAFLVAAAGLIIAIAVLDWSTEPYFSIGFLYLFPIMLAAGYLRRWQITGLALVCAVLQEGFSNLPPGDAVPRLVLSSAGFAGAGLLITELLRNRRRTQLHLEEMEREVRRREEAEQQVRILVESSPAAIVTVDAGGRIQLANAAAQELFAPGAAALAGQSISGYLPTLARVVGAGRSQQYRTSLQCKGSRASGEVFLAAVWFSTYETSGGSCLAAIVVDLSDDLRSREELSLDHLLQNAGILMSAVSHEVRNLCGAALAVHRNLQRVESLRGNQDFEALGTVIAGLERISSMELKPRESEVGAVDLPALFDELRVLIEPAFRDAGMAVRWQLPPDLPLVWADRYGLLHACLNLARNSQRAMAGCPEALLTVSAAVAGGAVAVRFCDTGPGVASPEVLFRPFQPTPGGTGLGLYVSRALVRGFGGELAYEPRPRGCCFKVTLLPMPSQEESRTDEGETADPDPARRRSPALS
jgi:two-component system, LuxR family, sensor kinase FixL